MSAFPSRTAARTSLGMAAGLVLAGAALSAQLKTPTDWRWRTDTPSPVSANSALPGDSWYYVAMPPGWHVTTRPGVLLYHPDQRGQGRFTLESEVFLFPGDAQTEYGLFIGGRDVDEGTVPASYVAFVLRRDGSAAVIRQTASGQEPLAPWTAHAAILKGNEKEPVKNVLRVEVGAAAIDFTVNGQQVVSVPKDKVEGEGRVGLRFGAGLNLHVTTFDVTFRLAPPRRPSA